MLNRDSAAQDTVIAAGLEIKGDLKCPANLYFDGVIAGNIECQGDVNLGPNAYVDGNISCQNLAISGQIKGNVTVSRHLAVRNGGQIKGNVNTTSLSVEEGGILNGQLTMATAANKPTD